MACNVVTNATFFLPMGSKLFCGSVTVVDPFCNCNLKPGCVVTTCIICTCLQLKSMSDWPEDVVYQGTHTGAQKTSRLSAASALFLKLGTSMFRSLRAVWQCWWLVLQRSWYVTPKSHGLGIDQRHDTYSLCSSSVASLDKPENSILSISSLSDCGMFRKFLLAFSTKLGRLW